jgi:hypothetical protein
MYDAVLSTSHIRSNDGSGLNMCPFSDLSTGIHMFPEGLKSTEATYQTYIVAEMIVGIQETFAVRTGHFLVDDDTEAADRRHLVMYLGWSTTSGHREPPYGSR